MKPLLFGEVALKLKLLTVDQVEEALKLQDRDRANGGLRTVGAILHDLGHLDLVQVTRILKEMGHHDLDAQPVPGYDVEEIIGRGMSGAVYRGQKPLIERQVAIKVRAPRCPGDDPDGRRFIAEARLGIQLHHPHIVELFDAGATRDYLYHVMEFVDGASLQRRLKEKGQLPEDLVRRVGAQISRALEHAHKHGIIHRDVKPANILISKTGVAKLCDLGLAKDTKRATVHTADGILLGSPYYIAPEYAREGKIDGRSDLYSLGVALFQAATGTVPFEGQSALEILQKTVSETAPDPRMFAPNISQDLSGILMRLLAKKPEARFQTPNDLALALEAPIPGPEAATVRRSSEEGTWQRIMHKLKRKS